MIAPMLKYAFVVYHADYNRFLEQLHRLGLVHIETVNTQLSAQAEKLLRQLHKVHEALALLSKRTVSQAENVPFLGSEQLLEQFETLLQRETELKKHKKELQTQIAALEPWGNVPADIIELLQNRRVFFHFFHCAEQDYRLIWSKNHKIAIINRHKGKLYFVLISELELPPLLHGAELQHLPAANIETLYQKFAEVNVGFEEVNMEFNRLATHCNLLHQFADDLENELARENALQNTRPEADGKLMLLQAWVPQKNRTQLLALLNQLQMVWVEQKPDTNDRVPVLLENNRFAALFHPVVNLFSLPAYTEIDLTPFFAPFFMLFFGMCLGDVAYGLLIMAAVTVLKYKKQYSQMRPLFTLAQLLGAAAVAFGLLTGTVAGIDLAKSNIGFLTEVKTYFINVNSLFNVSLIIGLVQIVFGMALRAANNWVQKGAQFAISPLGWILGIAGGLLYIFTAYTLPAYLLLGLALFCVIVFSDPNAGILKRIGLGLWDLYGITGLFGDVLSYVRLFALGLSSATLGFVVNTIALSALTLPPVLGELFFIVILLLGHGLNFGISALSSFVHPIRLTFVEFYKNAGFTGGGVEYQPFRFKNSNNHKQ
ncbi:hypothetical protein C7N43_07300 [Sphingobacteriales bacterium UPWRP_1]|nr:hypothetical protein B6N25_05140 [Sphingobacteriales bacterium TSM_CSS]PSJ77680.1 hypothetical protein C7N43_07300 [Sphingobacteriales bacterium UPWRP_1]